MTRHKIQQSATRILESMSDAFAAIDRKWRYTYVNAAEERIVGLRREDMLGRIVWELFPQEGTKFKSACHRAMYEGVTVRLEEYYPPLGLWFEATVYPSADGITVYARDITERKRAEEVLRKAHSELESRVEQRTAELNTANARLRNEITERKRSEQRLSTQYAITRVLAESDTLAAATSRLLEAMGESMQLQWGALWVVDREAAVIRCQNIWHAPNIEAAEFDAVSRETAFTCGQGLLGHVWETASPAWIDDVTNTPVVIRAPIAARAGLRGAIAFPILLGGQPLGVIEFFSRKVQQPDEEQLAMLSAFGSQIGQFTERKRAEEERKRLLHRLVLAQEEERRRIACDLHDDLMQRLGLLRMNLDRLRRNPPGEPSQVSAQVHPLADQVTALAGQVRQLSHRLHPSILEDLGLQAGLNRLVAEFKGPHGMPAHLSIGELPRSVPLPIASALYRIAQEALRNAGKHAPRAAVTVTLSSTGSELRLTIADNGPGFDVEAVHAKGGGLGLVSIQERASLVDGHVSLRARPGEGTHVEVAVPWPKEP